MSPEWQELVVFAIREAARLGLEFTMNMSSSGGKLDGPWEVGEDAPKRLVYMYCATPEAAKAPVADLPYYHDIDVQEVWYTGPEVKAGGWQNGGDGVYTMSASSGKRLDATDNAGVRTRVAPGTPGAKRARARARRGRARPEGRHRPLHALPGRAPQEDPRTRRPRQDPHAPLQRELGGDDAHVDGRLRARVPEVHGARDTSRPAAPRGLRGEGRRDDGDVHARLSPRAQRHVPRELLRHDARPFPRARDRLVFRVGRSLAAQAGRVPRGGPARLPRRERHAAGRVLAGAPPSAVRPPERSEGPLPHARASSGRRAIICRPSARTARRAATTRARPCQPPTPTVCRAPPPRPSRT